jgi:hypothetical protein
MWGQRCGLLITAAKKVNVEDNVHTSKAARRKREKKERNKY